jgi:hypothetical protein
MLRDGCHYADRSAADNTGNDSKYFLISELFCWAYILTA